MILPSYIRECLDALENAGFAAYAVGGCVRDACLGLAPQDFDLCTAALPEQTEAVFAHRKLVLAGKKHGTVGVVTDFGVVEITTFRTEGTYNDNRHPDWVDFVTDIEQDLARRDFTVNAMAWSPKRGFADPFGGRADLESRTLRAVGESPATADAAGINVTKYKLTAFIISAAFAGIAGVMYSFANSTVTAASFDYNYSIEILVMVVLGGMGNINGSILSATLITILNDKLTVYLTGDNAVFKDLFYALILILIIIYNNAPALKSFREKYNFRNLMNKIIKKKHDPSEVKGDAARWDVVPTKIEMNEVLSTDLVIDKVGRGDDSADIRERGGNK